ncbi:hypothetical protein PROFUN_04435 [Planoprotostelium fungivorum]|uniref:MYND-type domain-containing protein n=1 Tax=Planoprotostelium fungivorum TaxID=1890364 RepID=A0A2P6NVL1_9EUKA|nr:hypothetical protein PROFUN_04435 [Planoprotostelium fungivorum]
MSGTHDRHRSRTLTSPPLARMNEPDWNFKTREDDRRLSQALTDDYMNMPVEAHALFFQKLFQQLCQSSSIKDRCQAATMCELLVRTPLRQHIDLKFCRAALQAWKDFLDEDLLSPANSAAFILTRSSTNLRALPQTEVVRLVVNHLGERDPMSYDTLCYLILRLDLTILRKDDQQLLANNSDVIFDAALSLLGQDDETRSFLIQFIPFFGKFLDSLGTKNLWTDKLCNTDTENALTRILTHTLNLPWSESSVEVLEASLSFIVAVVKTSPWVLHEDLLVRLSRLLLACTPVQSYPLCAYVVKSQVKSGVEGNALNNLVHFLQPYLTHLCPRWITQLCKLMKKISGYESLWQSIKDQMLLVKFRHICRLLAENIHKPISIDSLRHVSGLFSLYCQDNQLLYVIQRQTDDLEYVLTSPTHTKLSKEVRIHLLELTSKELANDDFFEQVWNNTSKEFRREYVTQMEKMEQEEDLDETAREMIGTLLSRFRSAFEEDAIIRMCNLCMKKCTFKQARYCNVGCQKSDWEKHKTECIPKKVPEKVPERVHREDELENEVE